MKIESPGALVFNVLHAITGYDKSDQYTLLVEKDIPCALHVHEGGNM